MLGGAAAATGPPHVHGASQISTTRAQKGHITLREFQHILLPFTHTLVFLCAMNGLRTIIHIIKKTNNLRSNSLIPDCIHEVNSQYIKKFLVIKAFAGNISTGISMIS